MLLHYILISSKKVKGKCEQNDNAETHKDSQQFLQKEFVLVILLASKMFLGVDRVENISMYHIDISIIVNKHCWEVISFNQSLAGWETAFITMQMNPPTGFCRS